MFPILFSIILYFLSVSPVSAHGSGPPYLKINNQYTRNNPLVSFVTPTQIPYATEIPTGQNYLANANLTFEVDDTFLPRRYDGPIKFRWSFGDGSETVEGKKIAHRFSKVGTYYIEFSTSYPGNQNDFQKNETIAIDIVPDANYQLPTPKISVNGKQINNPERDIYETNPDKTVTLSGENSTGQIQSYLWDLGDNTTSQTLKVAKKYQKDYYPIFPVLRVTDKNGFQKDTYVFLDTPLETPNLLQELLHFFHDLLHKIFKK